MSEPAPTYTAHQVALYTQRQIAALKQQIAGLVAERDLLAAEIEAAHAFLDECYIGGDGTENLVHRIGKAMEHPA